MGLNFNFHSIFVCLTIQNCCKMISYNRTGHGTRVRIKTVKSIPDTYQNVMPQQNSYTIPLLGIHLRQLGPPCPGGGPAVSARR